MTCAVKECNFFQKQVGSVGRYETNNFSPGFVLFGNKNKTLYSDEFPQVQPVKILPIKTLRLSVSCYVNVCHDCNGDMHRF